MGETATTLILLVLALGLGVAAGAYLRVRVGQNDDNRLNQEGEQEPRPTSPHGVFGSPGTISKILWHFTGSGKAEQRAFEILCLILESGVLRKGKVAERFNNILGTGSMSKGVEVHTDGAVCLAEIPIQHLHYHSQRYGRCAMSL